MGVPRRSLKLGVSKQFTDHRQPFANEQPAGCECMAQIVNAYVAQFRSFIRVVSVEGPIHESEIVVRIRSAWGLMRAGNRIREAVQAAIKAAKRKGDIAGGPFYLLPEQAVVVRNRSDVEANTLRKPEILPPEEVRVAIAELVEENYGAERNQLIQAVARLVMRWHP